MTPPASAAALALRRTEPSPSQKQPAARATAADLSFLARIGAGDESALVELVYQYQPALLRLALIFVDNRALAEEVVHETWTGVLERIAYFEGQCTIKAWIFGILVQRARRRVIREARSVPLSSARHSAWEIEPAIDLAPLGFEGDSADSKGERRDATAEKLIEREPMRCLRHALQRLPPRLRAVVTLRDIEGLDSAEVGQLLGIGEATQQARLQRARSSLRRALDKHLLEMQAVPGSRNANS